jgi:hypothetical protein
MVPRKYKIRQERVSSALWLIEYLETTREDEIVQLKVSSKAD